jgi:hypothetical protein
MLLRPSPPRAGAGAAARARSTDQGGATPRDQAFPDATAWRLAARLQRALELARRLQRPPRGAYWPRMAEQTREDANSLRLVLVIGEGPLVEVVRRALDDAGAEVRHLAAPMDSETREAMSSDVEAVWVICPDGRLETVAEHLQTAAGASPSRPA